MAHRIKARVSARKNPRRKHRTKRNPASKKTIGKTVRVSFSAQVGDRVRLMRGKKDVGEFNVGGLRKNPRRKHKRRNPSPKRSTVTGRFLKRNPRRRTHRRRR